MKLFKYEGHVPNFGDDLNDWLLPKLMPEVINDKPDDGLFVGIGSLIDENIPDNSRVIIFGTGYGYGKLPGSIPKSWHIYGVRGLLSVKKLGLDPEMAIGDAAILTRTVDLPRTPGCHAVSFMPHWESAVLGAWPEVCGETGVNFIDPRGEVDLVLQAIRSSRLMISTSMHGAIIADAFRVPWIAVRPFGGRHGEKWHDWASALDTDIAFVELPASTLDEAIHSWSPKMRDRIRRLWPIPPTSEEKWISFSRISKKSSGRRIKKSAEAIKRLASLPGQLSSDLDMERVTNRLLESLAKLRRDYATENLSANRR
jgi:succinoglycan biosynthesis protein ExoV